MLVFTVFIPSLTSTSASLFPLSLISSFIFPFLLFRLYSFDLHHFSTSLIIHRDCTVCEFPHPSRLQLRLHEVCLLHNSCLTALTIRLSLFILSSASLVYVSVSQKLGGPKGPLTSHFIDWLAAHGYASLYVLLLFSHCQAVRHLPHPLFLSCHSPLSVTVPIISLFNGSSGKG